MNILFKNIYIEKILLLTLFMIFLSACKTSPTTISDAMGECSSKVSVEESYGDTIRLKYRISEESNANKIAGDWCDAQGKIFTRNTMNCSGCCSSTYLCHSKTEQK